MVRRPRSVSAPMSAGLIPAAIIAAVIAPADEPAAPENHRRLFRTASSAPAYRTPLAPPRVHRDAGDGRRTGGGVLACSLPATGRRRGSPPAGRDPWRPCRPARR